MKYAIIAAGEGSRLAAEGIQEPKPLVRVEGQALIDRLMKIFLDNDAEEIVVICNTLNPLVEQHLRQLQNEKPVIINIWEKYASVEESIQRQNGA